MCFCKNVNVLQRPAAYSNTQCSARSGQPHFFFYFYTRLAVIYYCLYIVLWCSPSLVSFQILDEIAEHGIKIYQLPDADSDEDEEFKEQTRVLKVRSLPARCRTSPHTL